MIARDIDQPGAAPGQPLQCGMDLAVAGLLPGASLQGLEIDDVADQKQLATMPVPGKVQQQLGLAARRAQMDIGYEGGAAMHVFHAGAPVVA